MRTSDSRLDPERVLSTDRDLQEVLRLLLREANQRQFWLIFLDRAKRIVGPLMPMDDYPISPDSPSEIEGRVDDPMIDVLRDRIGEIVQLVGAASLVLVWERRGPAKFSNADLSWARAFSAATADGGPPIRAQFVLHSSGIRQIAVDDLI